MSDIKQVAKILEDSLKKLEGSIRQGEGKKASLDEQIAKLQDTHKEWADKVEKLKSIVAEAIKKASEPKEKELDGLIEKNKEENARATQGRIDAEGRKKEYEDKLKDVERASKKAVESRDALEALRHEAAVIKAKLQKVFDDIKAVIQ